MLRELYYEPRVIVAEAIGSDDEEGEEECEEEDSFIAEMPIRKRRKMPEPDTTRITKHFKLVQELPPIYTGGHFVVSKDFSTGWAMNNCKVTKMEVNTGKHLMTLSEENEEILSFAVSPNDKMIATANKNYIIRVYALNGESEEKPVVL